MPRRRVASFLLGVTAVSLALTRLLAGSPQPAPQLIASTELVQDIHALLASKCLGCHGDKLKLSRLDLRTRDGARRRRQGPALVPGNAEQSRLYRLVAGLDAPAMPMRGTPLTAGEIATMKRWIDEGAVGTPAAAAARPRPPAPRASRMRPLTAEERSYWAFKLPVQAPLPRVARAGFTNPSIAFSNRRAATRADARRRGPTA